MDSKWYDDNMHETKTTYVNSVNQNDHDVKSVTVFKGIPKNYFHT